MAYTLQQQMVRTTGLLQALPAVLTMVLCGHWAWENAMYFSYLHVYGFIKETFSSFISVGILWVVLVQRYTQTVTPLQTFRLELIKSSLATVLWLWMLLDRIFAPMPNYTYVRRKDQIAKAAFSVVVPLFLFYPTLVYAYKVKNSERQTQASVSVEEGQAGETAPLLGN